MAKVQNVSGEVLNVPELGYRNVGPDEVVEVPDDRLEGYVCQPATWVESKGGE